jgi:hypothetical protein
MNSHCLTILDELGYIPVPSKAEYIVSDSIKKSFESLFGNEATVSILNHLTSLYGLSEKELTTNYDIFEKSLIYYIKLCRKNTSKIYQKRNTNRDCSTISCSNYRTRHSRSCYSYRRYSKKDQ